MTLKISKSKIDFIYVKATEGEDFNQKFEENYSNAVNKLPLGSIIFQIQ
jgi:GH25 family lysozyme M1 (1,4-beta-N-acetylmuramidase)